MNDVPYVLAESGRDAANEDELTQNDLEDHIPQLNDILKTSFISVHTL